LRPRVLGAVLRRAMPDDGEAIARVHVQGWRDAYPGIVPQAEIDRRTVAEYAPQWRAWLAEEGKRGFVWDEGRVRGFAVAGPARDDAPAGYPTELYALYVDRDVHGRGIGRALFEACRAATGDAPLALWVLERNPSRAFYDRMGGRVVARRDEVVGGALLGEVAYGWR